MPNKVTPTPRYNPGTEIGLADVIITMQKLGYDNENIVTEYLRCLGFEKNNFEYNQQANQNYASTQLASNVRDKRINRKKKKTQFTPPTSSPPAPQPPLSATRANATFKELPPLSETENTLPEQFDSIEVIREDMSSTVAAKRLPIFSHLKSRGLMTEMISQPVAGSEINIIRLINLIVKQIPIKLLPILPRITAKNGCQIMLDMNSALIPLWPDMRELIEQFQTILKDIEKQVYVFEDFPKNAILQNYQDKAVHWKPIPHVPLILVSDLGVKESPDYGIRSGKKTWLDLAKLCKKNKVPLIVLTPLERDNIPNGLPPWMRIIRWSGSTTASDIKCIHHHERRKYL